MCVYIYNIYYIYIKNRAKYGHITVTYILNEVRMRVEFKNTSAALYLSLNNLERRKRHGILMVLLTEVSKQDIIHI